MISRAGGNGLKGTASTDTLPHPMNQKPIRAPGARKTYFKPVAIAAIALLLTGGVLLAVEASRRGTPAAAESSGSTPPASSLVDTSGSRTPSTGAEPAAEEDSGWSMFFVKGGFSLFLGFCIGYALRTFLKVSMVAFGIVGLCILGLSYGGVLDVDWARISAAFDGIASRVKDEAQGFQTFLTGSLPAAGMAGLGLVTGLKRR